jgi:hypothetical protein
MRILAPMISGEAIMTIPVSAPNPNEIFGLLISMKAFDFAIAFLLNIYGIRI